LEWLPLEVEWDEELDPELDELELEFEPVEPDLEPVEPELASESFAGADPGVPVPEFEEEEPPGEEPPGEEPPEEEPPEDPEGEDVPDDAEPPEDGAPVEVVLVSFAVVAEPTGEPVLVGLSPVYA